LDSFLLHYTSLNQKTQAVFDLAIQKTQAVFKEAFRKLKNTLKRQRTQDFTPLRDVRVCKLAEDFAYATAIQVCDPQGGFG
jgi:hypothetical protein